MIKGENRCVSVHLMKQEICAEMRQTMVHRKQQRRPNTNTTCLNKIKNRGKEHSTTRDLRMIISVERIRKIERTVHGLREDELRLEFAECGGRFVPDKDE